MRRIALPLLVLGIVAVLGFKGSALLPDVRAAQWVSNPSVSGSYNFDFQGVNPISVGNLPSVGAAVGVVNFDGAGHLTGRFTLVNAQACCITGATTTSTITTGTFTGTYTMTLDAMAACCTANVHQR